MRLQNNSNQYQVSLQAQDNYKVIDHHNRECKAKLTGQLLKEAKRPVVGDVIVGEPQNDFVLIKAILPRKSVLKRQNQDAHHRTQIIAANLDYVFITMSVNQDFNLARLDRYTTLVWDSGANPVIVLTKVDLVDEVQLAELVAEIEENAYGIPIITTQQADLDVTKFTPYLNDNQNVVFIGSSGVGKSTLINLLLGTDVEKTSNIRQDDDKGRHTTTTSRMHILSNGAKIIDTPGIRAVGIVGVSQAATDQTFNDITELAQGCRFSDCKHASEPGCAVKAAIEKGQLSETRLVSYQKLQHEMQYAGLSARQIEQTKVDRMFKSVGGVKAFKQQLKNVRK